MTQSVERSTSRDSMSRAVLPPQAPTLLREPLSTSPPPLPTQTRRDGARLGPAGSGRRRWQRALARSMFATDAASLCLAFALAHLLWIGPQPAQITFAGLDYWVLSVGFVLAWLAATAVFHTRDHKLLGAGAAEYQALAKATFFVFGWVAILSLLFRWNLSRGFLLLGFAIGFGLLLVSRWAWRYWLRSRRARRRLVARTLVIGGARSARTMATRFETDPSSEFALIGLWVPDRSAVPDESLHVGGLTIPVRGVETDLSAILDLGGIDTVVVTDTEHLGHAGMGELAWELEGREIDLLVAPNILDVAGPRIHVDAHGAMPLIYLSKPTYSAARTFRKAMFDRCIALGALTVAAPILITAALAVRLNGAGPIFYRSERIGRNGRPFQMLKLRTMIDGADRMRVDLESSHDGAGPLFKLVDDPRVTAVGRFLRRYSIDELPQFVNVLRGEMSVVGPRPPLRSEVDLYDDTVRRRLLVQQGVTGLWQVSGRSDLSWEDAVRLDLTYVENWSMLRDLHIIVRTARAVFFGRGAY